MTTIEFYKKISRLLTDTRDQFITLEEAEEKLDKLLKIAESNGIEIHFDKSILQWGNLFKLDDESMDETDVDELDF